MSDDSDMCRDMAEAMRDELIDTLQRDLATVQGERERYKEALEKLSRLGNEPHLGNSEGNCIAQAALAQPAAPSARVAVKK